MTSPEPISLTARLLHIGCRFAEGEPAPKLPGAWIDLEATLIDALAEALREQDLRLLSVVLTWASIHGDRLIVEKWEKLLKPRLAGNPELLVWARVFAAYLVHYRNPAWKRLLARGKRPTYLLPMAASRSLIRLNGQNRLLSAIHVVVPEGTIRIRPADVFTVEELVARNSQYRNRYLFGPSWRADIITALQMGCSRPTEISRMTGCSYEPAHRVLHEYRVAQPVNAGPP